MTGAGVGLWLWWRTQPRWARWLLFVFVAVAVGALFLAGRAWGRRRSEAPAITAPAPAAAAGGVLQGQAADARTAAEQADAAAAAVQAENAARAAERDKAAADSAAQAEKEHAQVAGAGSCADVDVVVYGRRTDGDPR